MSHSRRPGLAAVPRDERIARRIDAASAGLTRLQAAERAIEAAYTATAEMAADLPRLRADAYLAATVGQPALEETTATLGHLTAALNAIARTHGRMADLGDRIGMRNRLGGVPDKPPEDPKPPPPDGLLRANLELVGAV